MTEYIDGNAPGVQGSGPQTTTTTYKASTMNVQSVTTLSQSNDSSTAVLLWDLGNPRIKHAVESQEIKESITLLSQNDIRTESAIDDGNFRARVNLKDYAPGGRYRGEQIPTVGITG